MQFPSYGAARLLPSRSCKQSDTLMRGDQVQSALVLVMMVLSLATTLAMSVQLSTRCLR